MTLKMAVFAPIPSASVNTATKVKAGCCATRKRAFQSGEDPCLPSGPGERK